MYLLNKMHQKTKAIFKLFFLQFQSGLPVTSRSGAILKTTVVREKWELNNDDIELVILFSHRTTYL